MANATGSCIEITYDTFLDNGFMLPSWPSGTKILGGSGAVESDYYKRIDVSWIDHAELEDGTPITYSQYSTGFYDFGQEGTYVVRYYPRSLINVRDTYNYIPDMAFNTCERISSAKLIYANDSQKDIKVLKTGVFRETSLTCITLPEGFRKFDGQVLFNYTPLECITIPASMTEPVSEVLPANMGAGTFDHTPLNKIFAKGMTAPKIASNAFDEVQSGGTLYYPAGADYTEWLNALAPYSWKWATYNPYAVDTCDCVNDGENIPIIDSGTTIPPSGGSPYIYLSGLTYMTLASGGSCNSLPIVPVNCDYDSFTASIEYNPNLTAHSIATVTEENGSLKFCLTSNPNSGYTEVAIITVNLYDTSGNTYLYYCALDQYGTASPTPEPPIPTGTTVDSGSTAITENYSGCPLVFDHSASTGTWNTLPTVTTGGSDGNWWITYSVPANDTDSARTITYYYLQYSGSSCDELVDTISYTISQAAGSGTPTPSDRWMYLDPSGKTFSATDVGDYYFYIRSSGCSIDRAYTPTFTFSGDTSWINSITSVSFSSGRWSVRYRCSRNLGNSDREIYITVNGVHDTDGNVYNGLVYHATQAWGSYIYLEKGGDRVPSAGTIDTAQIVPVNTRFCFAILAPFDIDLIPENLWEGVEQPTLTVSGNNLTVVWPENPHADVRSISARMSVVWGETCDDTTFLTYAKLQEAAPAPPDRWVYLDPSATTISASGNGTYTFYVRGSGCSIDDSYTPTFTFSGDTSWINSISSVSFSSGRWSVAYNSSRNLANSSREVYITVNGVHDTDGNVYDDLVYHVTQNYGSYVFLNYDEDHNAPSGSSVETVEVVPVNTTVCSISVTSSSTTPDLWVGVARPTVTILGNYITVNWPENPYPTNRNYQLSVVVVWGENCENTTTLTFNKNQNAGPTPVQKDIKATNASYSVGSGSGNASTTVQTTGCTYDHFTYITGGSFSVTATSGPNNTIVFTYPKNSTTSPRTGYVYITFYDSDGNAYGPQTIFFTQQAGSSPGPGPGPDPETGYVLTTLTISDQEQHRYFVEARPGIVYSAAGQYYKTIPACEARYSLYYVNSYGGVDVLPFKGGGQKKTDNITRFNYSRSFRNNTPEFENVNYMNEIKAGWELQTGWMSDESSQRMHELVESTIVYLYDAEEMTYTPVVMTDKKLEYKTYRNQGRKFYNYTVNVEESQSKERR